MMGGGSFEEAAADPLPSLTASHLIPPPSPPYRLLVNATGFLCSFPLPIMKLTKFKSLSLSPKRLFRRSRRSFPSSNHLDGSTTSATSSSSGSVLTRRDLEALLGRIGMGACSQDEVEAMLMDVGLGVEEGVGIDELVGRLGSVCGGGGGEGEEELRQAFEFFDEDGDGRITAEELLGVLGGVMGDEGCTLEDCRRMIAGVDGNRDGFVCFEDFSRMMMMQQQQPHLQMAA